MRVLTGIGSRRAPPFSPVAVTVAVDSYRHLTSTRICPVIVSNTITVDAAR
jgi:hypothetical protein